MSDVVRFRPSDEEAEAIERVRKAHGFGARAEAVRHLIRAGARQVLDWREDPLFRFEIDDVAEPGEDITSRDIDRELYGDA